MAERRVLVTGADGFIGSHLAELLVKQGRLNQTTDHHIQTMRDPILWEKTDSRTPADIRRLSKILTREPVYMETASHPLILDTLESLLGPNIELLTNKHNHLMVRPPGSAAVPWHTGEEIYGPVLFTALIYLEESKVFFMFFIK